MIKKTMIAGLACGLFAGALLLYETQAPWVGDPPVRRVVTDRMGWLKTLPARAIPAVGPDTAREEQVQQTRFARIASLSHLVRRLNAAAQSGDPAARNRFEVLLAKLMRRSPEAAARFAQSLGVGNPREQAMHRVTQLWAVQNPAGAENWARQLDDPAERASALKDVCFQLARTDAAQAVAKAENYHLDAASGTVLVNLVQQWAEQDSSGAAEWIKARPAGNEREQMLWRLAIVQCATAPAEAVRLVTEQIPAGPLQTEAAISVLHQWAIRDLAGARAWVALFPAGAIRDRAEVELSGVADYQQRVNDDGL